MSSFKKITLTNLLTLVIWKCVYDRIVYIVKKVSIFFSKKGFFKGGGHNKFVGCCARKMCPYTNALVRPWV